MLLSHLVRSVRPNRMIAILMTAAGVIGIFERVTCPFETLRGFKQIMNPEFPLQYLTGQRAKSRRN